MTLIDYLLLGGLLAGAAMVVPLIKPFQPKSQNRFQNKIKINTKEESDGM